MDADAQVAQYAEFEALSDEEIRRRIAIGQYTLLSRTTFPEMTLEQLVAVSDAARTLLLSERDEGVRNALLDALNHADQEARRRNAIDPQRVVGSLRPGGLLADAIVATAGRN